MKPEAQRIAIAEACGWEHIISHPDGTTGKCPIRKVFYHLPNYLNDLNAMHEAEKHLLKNDALLWHRYAAYLDSDYVNQPYTVGATAAQRAEAFLRTINKRETRIDL